MDSGVYKDTKMIKEDIIPCKIEEDLYLGSLGSANNKSALKSLNVTHILTVANSLPIAHPNDFKYKIIEVRDKSDVSLLPFFNECFAFIEEARTTGGAVLVHCFDGRSRSVTIIVAYLMFKNGMSLSEAMEHVKGKRPVVSPNSGFMLQLVDYERYLRGCLKQLFVTSTNSQSNSFFRKPSKGKNFRKRAAIDEVEDDDETSVVYEALLAWFNELYAQGSSLSDSLKHLKDSEADLVATIAKLQQELDMVRGKMKDVVVEAESITEQLSNTGELIIEAKAAEDQVTAQAAAAAADQARIETALKGFLGRFTQDFLQ